MVVEETPNDRGRLPLRGCTLTAPTAPDTVTECNCSICRKLAARWAYYKPSDVGMPKAGSTQPYVWRPN